MSHLPSTQFTSLPAPSPSMTSSPSPPTPSSSSSPSSSTGTRRSVGHYIVTKRLGHGSFATVWRGYHRVTNESVAIKSISRTKLSHHSKHVDQLQSEIDCLKQLRHPNIVHLKDVKDTERHIYLIMEFCAGGDLSQFLRQHKALPLPLVQHFTRQLMLGLQLLHSRNLIHRDLKPQNLLLDQSTSPHTSTLKLADFGFARSLEGEDLAATLCGSPLYMAPEILRYQPYDGKADLWSVGAIVYEMVVGRPPYTGQNHIQLLQRIEREEVKWPEGVKVSEECKGLVEGLLKRRAEERMSWEEFFRHPFVQERVQRNNRSDPEERRGREEEKTEDGSMRVSSTLYNPSTESDPVEMRRSQKGGRGNDPPLPAPSPKVGRGESEVEESPDRAGIIVASSPPLDIPMTSYKRSASMSRDSSASPLMLPASTSPPLITSNSPPSPSPFLIHSSTRRSSSSSRSGSFDDRHRKDSASSSSDRAKTSGSIERDDYVYVEEQPTDSPSSQRFMQPASPSFTSLGASVGKALSSLAQSLMHTSTTPQLSPVTGSDSPTLPPISEVPYTVHEEDDAGEGDLVPSTSHPIISRFEQSLQSVHPAVHYAWTVAKSAEFVQEQAEEQEGMEEPLPLTERLRGLVGEGEVSLFGCALGLYVKALNDLHECVELMEQDYSTIMQERRYSSHEPSSRHKPRVAPSSFTTSAVYKNVSWQDVYGKAVSLITHYTAKATSCAQRSGTAASADCTQGVTTAFEVGTRTMSQPVSLQSSTASLATAGVMEPPPSSSAVLPPGSASTVLTFTSLTQPSTSPSSPQYVDPLLTAYFTLREWFTTALMHESSGEWSEADVLYRRALTLGQRLREEVQGEGGGGQDVELLNVMTEQLEVRIASVEGEATEERRKRGERWSEAMWTGGAGEGVITEANVSAEA